MNRCLAFLAALMLTAVSVSSACLAAGERPVRFTIDPERGDSAKVHVSFRDEDRDREQNSWSTDMAASELSGFDMVAFRAQGVRPVRFALVREAGRLDCLGSGGANHAWGDCRFTPDAAFARLLAARRIGQPTREQAFGLMAVNARRDVIDAIAAAGYPAPRIDDLMALAALGVDGRYIGGLARAGYRPRTIDTLVQFKALGITPEWIGGFVRVGYGNLPTDDLVQMKALGITPDYVAGFQRIGYRSLSPDTLVELKALGITPEFVRASVGQGSSLPRPDELVQMKLFGRRR
jgi:hypothetical protein